MVHSTYTYTVDFAFYQRGTAFLDKIVKDISDSQAYSNNTG
jgi:hypothetical protein